MSSSSDDCYCFERKDWFANCLESFDGLRRQQKLCDISVKLDNHSFIAHRVVLSATIPYFNAMLTNGMIESTQTEVVIPYTEDTIDSSAMESLLEFVYTGRIVITESNVWSLLKGSSYLQLDVILDACCEYLKKRLHANNVLDIKSFADILGCHSLVEFSKEFIQRYFKEVAKSDEFLSLDFCEIVDIVAKDELNVSGEDEVFDAVMAWVKRDLNERESKLPQLLSNVRLPLLPPEFLTDYVMKEELIRSSHSCLHLLNELKDFHLNPQKRPSLQNFLTRPRYGDIYGQIYVIGENCIDLIEIEVFNPLLERWEVFEKRITFRYYSGLTVINDKLYFLGGFDASSEKILTSVEVFDPNNKSWAEVSPMNCKRRDAGAVALNNMIYVCGGCDSFDEPDDEMDTALRTVECYSAEKNVWSMVEPMSIHRAMAGVVACEGKIYALGGHDRRSALDSVEMFEPQTGKWTLMPPMLTKRRHFGAATLRGKIYVCGGSDGSTDLQTAEVYDPNTQKWNFIEPMNVKRNGVALVANCGHMYAIGGYDKYPLNTVELYDPYKNRWQLTSSMVSLNGDVTAVLIPDK